MFPRDKHLACLRFPVANSVNKTRQNEISILILLAAKRLPSIRNHVFWNAEQAGGINRYLVTAYNTEDFECQTQYYFRDNDNFKKEKRKLSSVYLIFSFFQSILSCSCKQN